MLSLPISAHYRPYYINGSRNPTCGNSHLRPYSVIPSRYPSRYHFVTYWRFLWGAEQLLGQFLMATLYGKVQGDM